MNTWNTATPGSTLAARASRWTQSCPPSRLETRRRPSVRISPLSPWSNCTGQLPFILLTSNRSMRISAKTNKELKCSGAPLSESRSELYARLERIRLEVAARDSATPLSIRFQAHNDSKRILADATLRQQPTHRSASQSRILVGHDAPVQRRSVSLLNTYSANHDCFNGKVSRASQPGLSVRLRNVSVPL